jgi:hypothetical protein
MMSQAEWDALFGKENETSEQDEPALDSSPAPVSEVQSPKVLEPVVAVRSPKVLELFPTEGRPVSKAKTRRVSASARGWERVKLEALEMKKLGGWEMADPLHFLALYAIQHLIVYRVVPSEIDASPTTRAKACCVVRNLLANALGGDGTEMSEFIKWTWKREEVRGRQIPDYKYRVSWWAQFSLKFVDDWRREKMRNVGRAS